MKSVKVFKPLQVSLFTNGPHVAFMQRIYDELNSLVDRAEKLHIPDELMAEFRLDERSKKAIEYICPSGYRQGTG